LEIIDLIIIPVLALGTADSGRYLTVYFLYKKNKEAFIVTARDMTEKERKRYAKK
jgi:uncharacterized DUF497 family protein